MSNEEREVFRPRRPNQNPSDEGEKNPTLNLAERMRQLEEQGEIEMAAANQAPVPMGENSPIQIKGPMPPELAQMMGGQQAPKRNFGQIRGQEESPQPQSQPKVPKSFDSLGSANEHLKDLIGRIKENSLYEEIELPSKGKFYNGEDGPENGILSIRPMTGEEEQILATPRYVRKGQAINMIFQKCLKEGNLYRPENLLTIDRTYILIYLRCISYSTKYQVEIKCPECDRKFDTTIQLDQMFVEPCPQEYGPVLQDVLPNTKLPFTYKLSTGKDEQDITDYRERRIKNFGDNSTDDTLTYRTATLLDNIDGIRNKNDLQILLRNLPINDVNYIRNCINEPPFGIDTDVDIVCPYCLHDFEVDLPLEANFFFPRRKKESNQA